MFPGRIGVEHWLLIGLVIVGDHTQHSLVVEQDLGGQTFYYPIVLESVKGRQPLLWVPGQTLLQEIQEGTTLASHDLLKAFGARHSNFASGISYQNGFISFWIKEYLFPGRLIEDMVRRNTPNFHDKGELLHFVFTGENWEACKEFNQNASEAPHVDGSCVRNTQDNLRSSIEPGLNVGVNSFILETT